MHADAVMGLLIVLRAERDQHQSVVDALEGDCDAKRSAGISGQMPDAAAIAIESRKRVIAELNALIAEYEIKALGLPRADGLPLS